MKYLLNTMLVLALMSSCNSPAAPPLSYGDGVPLELAIYRHQQVSEVRYGLSFAIPLKQEEPIPAELNLSLTIQDVSQPLYLDFKEHKDRLLSLEVNEKEVPISHEKEHLIIPVEQLILGANTINIKFLAGELSLNRNEDYLYTLLVPDRARTLFPCFDQPDIKASYQLTITAPKDWEVLCAAPLQTAEEKGEFTQYQFKESDKMSTYLFSFVAGKFNSIKNDTDAFSMHLLYRETNPEKIAASIDPIFDLHQLSLDFLQDYTHYKFPFQKLDFAAIPGFQYGGMEHVGAIQYRESSLFLDSSATQSQEIRRAKLIAHETSHMWFGDLVTMKWFDDVWLKEVFANLMADKIINPVFTSVNHDLQFLTAHYPEAFTIDRTRGANAIRQPLDNLKNAGSLYGGIIYHKAPIMMRQLEASVGKDKFQEGMAEYIKTYAHTNATWNDLIAILDTKTSLDLNQWSQVWVNSPGRPILSAAVTYDASDHIESFEMNQAAEDGSHKIWPQLFDIQLVYPDSIHTLSVNLTDKQSTIVPAQGLPKPDFILYNSNGFGYGVFPIDTRTLGKISEVKEEVTRGVCYLNCYENTLNGNLSLDQAFTVYQKGLSTESNELILQLVCSEVSSIYWHYFTEEQRALHQPKLEELLYNRLSLPATANIKKTLFSLFKSVAYSNSGKAHLYDIWNKQLTIPNLLLNEDDYTDLAMLLAIYKPDKSAIILAKAKTEISNPDKLKRFDFLLPALSPDTSIRAAFFESFRVEKNREKESWVLDACGYIHHPLRQQSAIKYLPTSLDLLEEIQKTGDIFFPKAWLDQTIGRYASSEAYTILETFMAAHPDLDPSLRKKLLQATDDLYRVQTNFVSLNFE